MSDEGEQNRSEDATPHKLRKAREKGAVARGIDLGFASGLSAFIVYAWFAGRGLTGLVAETSQRAFVTAGPALDSPDQLIRLLGEILGSVARPLGFMAAVIFLVVLVFELIQTGMVFTMTPLAFDFSRLNPAKGFKRLFSVRILIETGKNVLKMAVYLAVAIVVIRYALREVVPTLTGARSLAEAMRSTGLRLMLMAVAAAVVFTLLDQFVTRRDFSKKMRMSRREVKREHRDREGDPRLKQKRRQLHSEFVKLSDSLRNIRGADVLITNPTHYAVALRYDRATMLAPVVVSQGSHQFAQRLKRLAFLYGVATVPSPELARALYRLPLNSPVPEALFKPVADIYLALREQRARGGASVHAA